MFYLKQILSHWGQAFSNNFTLFLNSSLGSSKIKFIETFYLRGLALFQVSSEMVPNILKKIISSEKEPETRAFEWSSGSRQALDYVRKKFKISDRK